MSGIQLLYTPQQQRGCDGYSAPCRTGNWSEDEYMMALHNRSVLEKKAQGTLSSVVFSQTIGTSAMPIVLPMPHEDGFVRFGDIVLLSSALGGVLAANGQHVVQGPAQKVYQVTRTLSSEALRRTCWAITPMGEPPADGLLRFDTPFALAAVGAIPGQELFLQGERYTITNPASSISVRGSERKHLAAAAMAMSHLTSWLVRSLEPNYEARRLDEKQPVPANTFVSLEHSNTKSHLNTDETSLRNEFGREFSVSMFTDTPICRGELFGRAGKNLGQGNHFAFTTGLTAA